MGCSKLVAIAQAEEPTHPAAPAAPSAKPPAAHGAEGDLDPTASGTRYGVPFAWELSKDEPLSQARSYLGEMLADNALNAGLGKDHFLPFADKQAPRATVVACSDSRVQSSAWDATPENDAFTIRNIGNQVTNAHGSVQYGLEHLHTPVLLVLGHTGCGAVKAAMGKLDALEPPIQAELKGLKLPSPSDPKMSERKLWAEAVVANVNGQVDFAVTRFGKLLREQKVMVVGAVYDFRNDLGRGYGRVSVVNVNGNTDTKRLRAFEAALDAPPKDAPKEPAGREPAKGPSLVDILKMQALDPHVSAVGAPQAKESPSAKDEHGHAAAPAPAPAHAHAEAKPPGHGEPAKH